MVALEVMSAGPGDPEPRLEQWAHSVRERLEKVNGVGKVTYRDAKNGAARFTVESAKGQHIRPELARAVIESGWQLNELHAMGLSLEEIFLQLTGAGKESPAESAEPAHQEAAAESAPEPASESSG